MSEGERGKGERNVGGKFIGVCSKLKMCWPGLGVLLYLLFIYSRLLRFSRAKTTSYQTYKVEYVSFFLF